MKDNTESKQISEKSESSVRDKNEYKQIIEAVLFAAGHPVKFRKIAEITGMTLPAVRKFIKSFSAEYNSDKSRGIIMLVFADSCQLCTKENLSSYVKKALDIKKGGNLSSSSLEVLAVLAYNEPVTRAFVDTVRGVDSSHIIHSLVERGLIEPCGRLDEPGRPVIYRTTPDFLRCFGIDSLEQLPDKENLHDKINKAADD